MSNNNTSNNSQGGKMQLTPEQIKQLMQLQQMMGKGQGQQQNVKKSTKILHFIFNKIHTLQHHLDRFINFIVKGEDESRNDVIQSARSPILFGTYVIFIFVVFGGLWMSLAPLNSAAVAIGTVISSSNKKTIQSAETGVIKNILVKQGDEVKEGDPLIELDDIRVKSDYESVLYQFRVALVSEARLIAERDSLEAIEFPEFITKDLQVPEVQKIVHTQENLFKYNREMLRARKESNKHQINQIKKQIEALEASKISAQKNFAVAKDRANSIRALFNKGVQPRAVLLEAEAKEAEFHSRLAQTEASIEESQQKLTGTEIAALNLDNEYLSKILSELRDVQVNRGVAQEKFNTVSFSLEKIIIKAPVDGTINLVNVHTIGGIVQAGTPLIELSPKHDHLIIEARISHRNIDAVKVGLVAKIRFSAFKSRTTSLFTGTLVSLSPDVIAQKTPQGYEEGVYVGKVEIDMDEFRRRTKNTKLELHPGMQAEVQIITGKRTLLRYLLDPLTDTMFRAFNEK